MNAKLLALSAFAVAAGAGVALAQASGIQPGQWETTVTIDSMEMPGAPAGIAKMMVGKTTRVTHCMTAEEAARGPQEMLKSNKSCTFTRYSMAGGRIDSEMTCKQGAQTTIAVSTGSFTPTSFTAKGRMVSTGQMATTMTMTSVGRRVGDCH